MKYFLVIGDGMADNPVPSLGDRTPLEYAKHPCIDSLAARGEVGSVINCPKPLPAGSETAILAIFGCDPLKYFSGRSPMEAAALGIPLRAGDACYRCNLVTMESGGMPYEEKRILSHSAGSISGEDAKQVVLALTADPEFAAALREARMEIPPVPTFRPLAVQHEGDFSGIRFIPPHDHLGEKCGPLLPRAEEVTGGAAASSAESGSGSGAASSAEGGSGSAAARAAVFAELQRLANRILEHHPLNERRRAEGKMPANGIWFWAEGTALQLPDFKEEFGCGGAVVSAVPICHGIGVLRGLEMVEVEGATGEIDTNFEGKMEAAWQKLNEYDFVCLHLEAPDECTHNGDLPGKLQSIEWLDSRLVAPLVRRMDEAGMEYRILLLSDHKTLTATRGHDGDPVPYLIYDSRVDTGRGGAYNEPEGLKGPMEPRGHLLIRKLFELN